MTFELVFFLSIYNQTFHFNNHEQIGFSRFRLPRRSVFIRFDTRTVSHDFLCRKHTGSERVRIKIVCYDSKGNLVFFSLSDISCLTPRFASSSSSAAHIFSPLFIAFSLLISSMNNHSMRFTFSAVVLIFNTSVSSYVREYFFASLLRHAASQCIVF